MEDREVIQVSVQLPVEALGHFSRLIEQLRQLAAEPDRGGGQVSRQSERSTTFDLDRFQALRGGPEAPPGVQSPAAEAGEATAVSAPVRKDVRMPDSAGAEAARPVAGEEAPPRRDPSGDLSPVREAETAQAPAGEAERGVPEAQAVRAVSAEPAEEIPVVRVREDGRPPEAQAVQAASESPVADAPAVRMDPESRIPEAEAVWAEMGEGTSEAPAVQAELPTGAEPPRRAGFAVTAGPETAQNRWTGVTEELVAASAAPLTAEAVSQAFRRDGRRYDNGFPLY